MQAVKNQSLYVPFQATPNVFLAVLTTQGQCFPSLPFLLSVSCISSFSSHCSRPVWTAVTTGESRQPALIGQLKSQILPHHFPSYVRKSSLNLNGAWGSAFPCIQLGYISGHGNCMARRCAALNTVERDRKRHLTGTGINCSLSNGFYYWLGKDTLMDASNQG